MKVYNTTDVETPELKQRGLMNQSIAVGDKMLAPGSVVEIDDETFARVQPSLQELVTLGAMAVNDLPEKYKAAKGKQQAAARVGAFGEASEKSGKNK